MHSKYAEIRMDLLKLFEEQKITGLVDEIKERKSTM